MVVGLTGPNAAGKGEVAAHFRVLGFAVHSLSDVVREEAAARGFPLDREHLIRTGNELRRAGGPGILAERILARIGVRDVVDSIRNPAEVGVLRRIPGFLLLGVDAPARVRFDRSLARSRPGDPATFEAFEERERQENSSDPDAQQLRATLLLADRIVRNEGTLEALRREVDRALAPERLL
ncbi:MAG: dephospho-CoA kinase [Acidobacteriia bacterium]|nr:dephospho-CoA kinase [Terriglobia bacterium]